MSHFFLVIASPFLCHCAVFIYFFMSLPDLIGQSISFPQPSTLSPVPSTSLPRLSLPCHCPHLSAVITRLDRVISCRCCQFSGCPGQAGASIYYPLPLSSHASAFFILSCPGLTGASPGFSLITYCLTRREQPDRVIGIRLFRVNKLPQEGVAIP